MPRAALARRWTWRRSGGRRELVGDRAPLRDHGRGLGRRALPDDAPSAVGAVHGDARYREGRVDSRPVAALASDVSAHSPLPPSLVGPPIPLGRQMVWREPAAVRGSSPVRAYAATPSAERRPGRSGAPKTTRVRVAT